MSSFLLFHRQSILYLILLFTGKHFSSTNSLDFGEMVFGVTKTPLQVKNSANRNFFVLNFNYRIKMKVNVTHFITSEWRFQKLFINLRDAYKVDCLITPLLRRIQLKIQKLVIVNEHPFHHQTQTLTFHYAKQKRKNGTHNFLISKNINIFEEFMFNFLLTRTIDVLGTSSTFFYFEPTPDNFLLGISFLNHVSRSVFWI